MTSRSIPPVLAVAALYLLHQDLWFWGSARPLVFGFLPVGLAWHAAYCVAVSLVMLWLTRVAWPTHLEHVRSEPGGVQETPRRQGSDRNGAQASEGRQAGCRGPRR